MQRLPAILILPADPSCIGPNWKFQETYQLHIMMPILQIDIIYIIWHHLTMRTTLSLDDDIVEEVKRYAESRSLALGKAVSQLVRRALRTPLPTRTVNGIQVFVLPPDSPTITTEKVRELDAEQ